jgi:hypothetical protein
MKIDWRFRTILEQTSGAFFYGIIGTHKERDYVLWFPKGKKTHIGKFRKIWFGPFKV